MTRPDSVFLPRTQFDAFLFARIGEDGSDTSFSVLSALARVDVDPWQEAASLAKLPPKVAIEHLRLLIIKAPNHLAAPLDAAVVATRLIELLPRRGTPEAAAIDITPVVSARDPRLVAAIIVSILIFGAVWALASNQPQAQREMGHPPSSGASSPPPASPDVPG